MDGQVLGQVGALGSAMADVAVQRERNRHLRLRRVATALGVVAAWLLLRALLGSPVVLGPQHEVEHDQRQEEGQPPEPAETGALPEGGDIGDRVPEDLALAERRHVGHRARRASDSRPPRHSQ